MACLFGHKLENGTCKKCGGTQVSGVLTKEEISSIVAFLDTYQMLYGRLALEGKEDDTRSTGISGGSMFGSLKQFFSNEGAVYDMPTWKITNDTLLGIQNALPEILTEPIRPTIDKIRVFAGQTTQ